MGEMEKESLYDCVWVGGWGVRGGGVGYVSRGRIEETENGKVRRGKEGTRE